MAEYRGSLDAETGKCARIRARDYESGLNAFLKRSEEPRSRGAGAGPGRTYTDERVRRGMELPGAWNHHTDTRHLADWEIEECAEAGLRWLLEPDV